MEVDDDHGLYLSQITHLELQGSRNRGSDDRLAGVRGTPMGKPLGSVTRVMLPYCGLSLEFDVHMCPWDRLGVPEIYPLPPVVLDGDWVSEPVGEGEQASMWDIYRWCTLDKLKSLRDWDTARKESLASLVLDIRDSFYARNVALVKSSSDSMWNLVSPLLPDSDGAKAETERREITMSLLQSQVLFNDRSLSGGVADVLLVSPLNLQPKRGGRGVVDEEGNEFFARELARSRIYFRVPIGSKVASCRVEISPTLTASAALAELYGAVGTDFELSKTSLMDKLLSVQKIIVENKQWRRRLVTSLRETRSLLEYDAIDYSFASVYVRFKRVQQETGRTLQVSHILHFDLAGLCPASPPKLTLLDPLSDFSKNIDMKEARYSPRWPGERIVSELMKHAHNCVFPAASFGVSSSPPRHDQLGSSSFQ